MQYVFIPGALFRPFLFLFHWSLGGVVERINNKSTTCKILTARLFFPLVSQLLPSGQRINLVFKILSSWTSEKLQIILLNACFLAYCVGPTFVIGRLNMKRMICTQNHTVYCGRAGGLQRTWWRQWAALSSVPDTICHHLLLVLCSWYWCLVVCGKCED